MTAPASDRGETAPTARRGQANLVALLAALFALTTAMVVGLAAADAALPAPGDDDRRRVASSVAGGLVAPEGPLATRPNVLDGAAVDGLTATAVERRYPALSGRSFEVTVGDEVVAGRGTPTGGVTVRRLVVVERTQRNSSDPAFDGRTTVTLPRRTRRLGVDVHPTGNVAVETVRADNRTVLHEPDGLSGRYTVTVSPRETVELSFVANQTLEQGDVTVTTFPRRTNKTTLGVTVGD